MQLRWYQEEAIQSIYNYFMTNSGNPLIALPTASGKSIIPAEFIKRAMHQWPNQRFLLITHIKELIVQNAEKLTTLWNNAPLGIHSAGLKSRDTALPVIYGGIQSMIKKPQLFGHRDLIFIDEAHLISLDDSSMYQTFLGLMKLLNPNVKIIGLTATPYRMGQGLLTDGGLFTHIIYDMTDIDGFNRLIAEGYLCPLIPKRTSIELDVSNVGMAKGEFIATQLQGAVDKQEITYKALRETCELGANRRSWLIFASGIEHSEHIAEMFKSFGIDCAAVHSKQPDDYNDRAIKAFRNGQLRAISNFGKLTTGFDSPIIDLIVDLRPTMSIPLHVQKYGRGMRIDNNKKNCLVLDFAKNTIRLGAVNDPIIPQKKGNKQGDAPIKICVSCGVYNHASARWCCNCGAEFEFKTKIVAIASSAELLRTDLPEVNIYDIEYVTYSKQQKMDKETKLPVSPPYIRAVYFTKTRERKRFMENVFPEHKALAKHKFKSWWQQRHRTEAPATTDEALKFVNELRKPARIYVWENKQFPEIQQVEF